MRNVTLTYTVNVDVEDNETPEDAGREYLRTEWRFIEPSNVSTNAGE